VQRSRPKEEKEEPTEEHRSRSGEREKDRESAPHKLFVPLGAERSPDGGRPRSDDARRDDVKNAVRVRLACSAVGGGHTIKEEESKTESCVCERGLSSLLAR